MTETTGNRQLAARARGIAASAPPGPQPIAAGCATVALATTRTTAAARAALIGQYLRPEVRAAALRLLGELSGDGAQ